MTDPDELQRRPRARCSYDRLRFGQLQGMQAVLAGRDVLAVMPTGAGKSAIHQVPGPDLGGPVVVVPR